MKNYSNNEIESLIKCRKRVVEPPKNQMRCERGSFKNDFKLESPECDGEFMAFLRVNEQFRENFSIGLQYIPKGQKGTITLLRCNGPHGPSMGTTEEIKHHVSFHIHRAKEENISAGFRAEKGCTATDEYACFEEALKYFLKEINVEDPDSYFPDLNQRVFDFMKREV